MPIEYVKCRICDERNQLHEYVIISSREKTPTRLADKKVRCLRCSNEWWTRRATSNAKVMLAEFAMNKLLGN